MAFAFVQDFPSGADETSTSNYDAIHSAIMEKATDTAGTHHPHSEIARRRISDL